MTATPGCAGADDVGHVVDRQPSDCHHRLAPAGGMPHQIEPARGIAGILCRGREHRAYGDVGRILRKRVFDLIDVVGGKPDDRLRGQQLAHLGDWQIVLPHVDSRRAAQSRDVRPIVDDEDCSGGVRTKHERIGQPQELCARSPLISKLQDSRAAGKVGIAQRDGIDPATAAHAGVNDGIEKRLSGEFRLLRQVQRYQIFFPRGTAP